MLLIARPEYRTISWNVPHMIAELMLIDAKSRRIEAKEGSKVRQSINKSDKRISDFDI